ncbi:hypothetical protein [Pararhizobium sp.]|uniref:hypothetical protein n=1 Tax=Pararhizobium sp. TaxID=1977563 RepID=UPI003BA8C969
MRARRCPNCGDRFYVDPAAPSDHCQNCTGDFDPSAQAAQDAANIALVNNSRVLGGRKQSVDLNTLRQAQAEANEAAQAPEAQVTKGRKNSA